MPPAKTARNKHIVRLRDSGLTFTEIARRYKRYRLTRQAVRQIYVRETTGVLLNAGAEFHRRKRAREAT